MMFAYRLWTWTAIAILAFGSIAVFVVFLVTTLRRLRGERNQPGRCPSPQEKPPPSGS